MYPIQPSENITPQTQENGEIDNETRVQENHEYIINPEANVNEESAVEDNQPIAVRLRRKVSKDVEEIHKEYCTWKSDRAPSKIKFKPTTNGKNWIKISKQNVFSLLRVQLPDYNEESWIKLIYIKLKDFTLNKNWKLLKFHIEDPSITNTEKVESRIC